MGKVKDKNACSQLLRVLKGDNFVASGKTRSTHVRQNAIRWVENAIFCNAPDRILKQLTGGVFPAKGDLTRTHPVFVLRVKQNGMIQICPMTSKVHPKYFYVRSGCVLDTGRKQDRDSYILDMLYFNRPKHPDFLAQLHFRGVAPKKCIMKGKRSGGTNK